MDPRHAVRMLIQKLLQKKGDSKPFHDTDSLALSGRLDSIDVLEIVVFLEKNYSIDFGNRPFDQSAVDSVDEIVSLIASEHVA